MKWKKWMAIKSDPFAADVLRHQMADPRTGFILEDSVGGSQFTGGLSCCWLADPRRSGLAELEVRDVQARLFRICFLGEGVCFSEKNCRHGKKMQKVIQRQANHQVIPGHSGHRRCLRDREERWACGRVKLDRVLCVCVLFFFFYLWLVRLVALLIICFLYKYCTLFILILCMSIHFLSRNSLRW